MRKRNDDRRMANLVGIMLIMLAVVIMILSAKSAFAADTDEDLGPVRTRKQEALHYAADYLREMGFAEDSEPIKVLQAEWWREQHDLDIIAKVIDGEAPYCPREHQVAVGAVVLNRVADDRFPDSVEEVVGQTSVINGRLVAQYSPTYCYGFSGILRTSYEAAAEAMNGNHEVPADIVWQANFPQGKEIWWESHVKTEGFESVTYFCR